MEHKRKTATQILIELEAKIDAVFGLVKNIENTQKILLGNFNSFQKLLSVQPPAVQPIISQPTAPPKKEKKPVSKFEEMKQAYGIVDDVSPLQQSKTSIPRRGQRTKTESSDIKVSVSQKILTSEKQPVFLASVEIFQKNGELVKKTRTSPSGSWVASLDPGEYDVHVIKRADPNSGKKSYSTNYTISINGEEPSVEFPPHLAEEI